jgi:hypothetical protein
VEGREGKSGLHGLTMQGGASPASASGKSTIFVLSALTGTFKRFCCPRGAMLLFGCELWGFLEQGATGSRSLRLAALAGGESRRSDDAGPTRHGPAPTPGETQDSPGPQWASDLGNGTHWH